VAVAAVLAAAAYRVAARRDLGEGLIPQRHGPVTAPWLRGPVALSWRVNRSLWLAWAGGIAFFAAGAGGMTTLAHQLAAAPGDPVRLLLEAFGGRTNNVVDAALWPIILIFAQVLTLYPVLMVQRLRAEEASGRAEAVQATPLGRIHWAGGHLAVAALGTAALLAVAGFVFGVFFAVLVGDPATDVGRVLGATVGTLPAALLVSAVGVLAYGLVPRAAVVISFTAWAATVAAGQVVGPLYGVWGGTPFEPFHYIPNTAAGAPFDPRPGLVMVVATAALVAGGLLALGRRDFGR
jgi:ABC-2 type transport system permease protein